MRKHLILLTVFLLGFGGTAVAQMSDWDWAVLAERNRQRQQERGQEKRFETQQRLDRDVQRKQQRAAETAEAERTLQEGRERVDALIRGNLQANQTAQAESRRQMELVRDRFEQDYRLRRQNNLSKQEELRKWSIETGQRENDKAEAANQQNLQGLQRFFLEELDDFVSQQPKKNAPDTDPGQKKQSAGEANSGTDSPQFVRSGKQTPSPSQPVAEPMSSPSVANGDMQNGKDNLDLPSADIAQKSTSLWDYIKDQWRRSSEAVGDARSQNPQLPSPEESADIMHMGLAVCGTSPVPILSQICDISDGVLYLFENNKTDAALSFGSAIPIWGVLAETGRDAKLVSKTTKATPRAKTITKTESDVWEKLKSFRGDIKTDGAGKSKRYYQWDHTHGNIEVYNRSGKHVGVMSAETGKMIGDAVPGRTISL